MDPLELMDRMVNGRPETKFVRIRLTQSQLKQLMEGKVLDFKAGSLNLIVSRK